MGFILFFPLPSNSQRTKACFEATRVQELHRLIIKVFLHFFPLIENSSGEKTFSGVVQIFGKPVSAKDLLVIDFLCLCPCQLLTIELSDMRIKEANSSMLEINIFLRSIA